MSAQGRRESDQATNHAKNIASVSSLPEAVATTIRWMSQSFRSRPARLYPLNISLATFRRGDKYSQEKERPFRLAELRELHLGLSLKPPGGVGCYGDCYNKIYHYVNLSAAEYWSGAYSKPSEDQVDQSTEAVTGEINHSIQKYLRTMLFFLRQFVWWSAGSCSVSFGMLAFISCGVYLIRLTLGRGDEIWLL